MMIDLSYRRPLLDLGLEHPNPKDLHATYFGQVNDEEAMEALEATNQ